MPDQNARIVRGLSIATVVISSLSILGALAMIVLVAMAGGFLNDPAFVQSVIDGAASQNASINDIAPSEMTALVSLSVGIVVAVLVWSMICSAVTLIAGIIGIRNAPKYEKLGTALGWAIAGAAMSFLTGRLITMALFIVSAVYLNKMRKYPPVSYGQPYDAYGQPYTYGQPYDPYR